MDKWRAVLVLALAALLGVLLFRAWPGLKERIGAGQHADAYQHLQARERWETVRERTASRPLVAVRVTPVTLREARGDLEWLRGVRITDQFDAMLDRAEKDPAFASTLASALSHCGGAARSYARNEVTFIVRSDKMIAVREREELDRIFGMCEGLTEDQRQARLALVTRAAQAGVFEAQWQYATIVGDALATADDDPSTEQIDAYRANAVAFTESAARSGDPEAIYSAYSMHNGRSYAAADPVRAQYWAREYARVNPGTLADKLLLEAALRLAQPPTASR